MKQNITTIGIIASVAALGLALSGCGKQTGTSSGGSEDRAVNAEATYVAPG